MCTISLTHPLTHPPFTHLPSREYQLEIKIGLSWGKPSARAAANASLLGGRNKLKDRSDLHQELHLPLQFSAVQVYSGLAPPAALVEAMRLGLGRTSHPQPRPSQQQQQQQHAPPPILPPRRPAQPQPQPQAQPQPQPQRPSDPLYPPQLQPGQEPYDDAPPTYEEAMAEEMTGPMIPSTARPAYSGMTNENAPSSLPEKGG